MEQMTITRFKEIATFIPKGRILPNWVVKIVKGNKKQKHGIKSNGCYVLTRGDKIWIVPQFDGEYAVCMKNLRNLDLLFNPYKKGRIALLMCERNYFDLVGNMPEE